MDDKVAAWVDDVNNYFDYRGRVLDSADKVATWIDDANNHFASLDDAEGLLLNVGDGYSLFRKRDRTSW